MKLITYHNTKKLVDKLNKLTGSSYSLDYERVTGNYHITKQSPNNAVWLVMDESLIVCDIVLKALIRDNQKDR